MIRTLYVGQQVQIVAGTTGAGLVTGAKITGYLPVSSASCEVTKPIEAVSAFGHLGSLAIAQTNLTTCKASVKTYLTSGQVNPLSGGFVSGICPALLSAITGDAVGGNYTVITVTPNGFTMSGLITSIGIDMSLGGFGTCDMSFNGIGQPFFASPSVNATSEQAVMPAALTPVTTIGVSGGILSGCANSFKFSLDMPTDTLACLGDNPDMVQSPAMNSLIATKPPYKSTISVEGFGVDVGSYSVSGVPPAGTKYMLGGLSISLPNAIVTSKSFNNAVGNANATYNYTIEDTSALFGN
jgi:hypothetical protein